jgi:hypothetical protein
MAIDTFTFRNTPYIKQFTFAGVTFNVFNKFLAVPAGASRFIELRTGPGLKIFHATERLIIPSGGPVNFFLRENPTITTPGTIVVPTNNINRLSAKISQARFFNNPIGVSGGTILEQLFIPSGTGANTAPSQSIPVGTERIYKQNTTYILEIVNNNNASMEILYLLNFYESGN